MGSESIAHETEGRMGYWLRGHEGEKNNCFSKIQLVGKKYRDKSTFKAQARRPTRDSLLGKRENIFYADNTS